MISRNSNLYMEVKKKKSKNNNNNLNKHIPQFHLTQHQHVRNWKEDISVQKRMLIQMKFFFKVYFDIYE